MENQHRIIKGYRELALEEIELMNEAKEVGAKVGDLIEKLRAATMLDQRAVALGATNIQQGFMWLIRGIAQPESFV
ncbi:DUF7681 family protein [Burkholderia gladioli]|uniref:Acb2/Tad1 domain-containing protein n=1 Tax=Burkholderia gladioli TaxID=28095 RepID=UPI003B50E393